MQEEKETQARDKMRETSRFSRICQSFYSSQILTPIPLKQIPFVIEIHTS